MQSGRKTEHFLLFLKDFRQLLACKKHTQKDIGLNLKPMLAVTYLPKQSKHSNFVSLEAFEITAAIGDLTSQTFVFQSRTLTGHIPSQNLFNVFVPKLLNSFFSTSHNTFAVISLKIDKWKRTATIEFF